MTLVRVSTILSGEEYQRRNNQALDRGLWNCDRNEFPPGTAWYAPWIYDPSKSWTGPHVLIRDPPSRIDARSSERGNFLGPHYWRLWGDKRPPLCIVGPNCEIIEPDRWSSNGDGWTVTFEDDLVTVTPSIVLDGWHGFLTRGEFSRDCEGRGETGVTRPYTPREKQ